MSIEKHDNHRLHRDHAPLVRSPMKALAIASVLALFAGYQAHAGGLAGGIGGDSVARAGAKIGGGSD